MFRSKGSLKHVKITSTANLQKIRICAKYLQMHKISSNLQKIIKSAKSWQICNNFHVGISIILQICKKSANLQKICKSAKNPQMCKISAIAQNTCKFAKNLQICKTMCEKRNVSFVFCIDDLDLFKDPTRLPHKKELSYLFQPTYLFVSKPTTPRLCCPTMITPALFPTMTPAWIVWLA
jgi:hypothetical protein